jgi:hypothetical protein
MVKGSHEERETQRKGVTKKGRPFKKRKQVQWPAIAAEPIRGH